MSCRGRGDGDGCFVLESVVVLAAFRVHVVGVILVAPPHALVDEASVVGAFGTGFVFHWCVLFLVLFLPMDAYSVVAAGDCCVFPPLTALEDAEEVVVVVFDEYAFAVFGGEGEELHGVAVGAVVVRGGCMVDEAELAVSGMISLSYESAGAVGIVCFFGPVVGGSEADDVVDSVVRKGVERFEGEFLDVCWHICLGF